MNIRYTNSLDGVSPEHLQGFFVGWARPLSPHQHLAMLEGSDMIELAIDPQCGRVVGFMNALCDGVQAAFIPCLEVLPAYQHNGIGSELVRRMLARLEHVPAVDLVCDSALQSFYEAFNMRPGISMMIRRPSTG